ncbi:hypothetical protein LJC10_04570 [Selenomonadales bacterium OttesenSCG-928-I06]|nr:hypothetical protein [Selenomonadales bacterium OttesenSCG-928-I06]
MTSDNNDNIIPEKNSEEVVQELSQYILYLLPIIENGFDYISAQLAAGKVEDSTAILEEVVKAISSVSSAMLTVFNDSEVIKDLNKSLKDFKETVRKLIPLYATNDLEVLSSVLNEEVIPNFREFKDKLEKAVNEMA